MPVSIVIGGQFGSEGKGKIALEIVKRSAEPVTVVRVGGPNSGHTAYSKRRDRHSLRQLPAACIDGNVDVVLPSGSFIDVDIFFKEIEQVGISRDRISVSENARVILPAHRDWERNACLTSSIGSTGSGVGAALMATVARGAKQFGLPCSLAKDEAKLAKFIRDVPRQLRNAVEKKQRIVVEGTQGFGLSLLDSEYWPKTTSRLTTAAGALSECGLSPLDVDDITMVIRSCPIRVSGNSGPLANETTWAEISRLSGKSEEIREFTTATKRLRRVGKFDPKIVLQALDVNKPTRLVMNHLDYIGPESDLEIPSSAVRNFITRIEEGIGRSIDWLGFSPFGIIEKKRRME